MAAYTVKSWVQRFGDALNVLSQAHEVIVDKFIQARTCCRYKYLIYVISVTIKRQETKVMSKIFKWVKDFISSAIYWKCKISKNNMSLVLNSPRKLINILQLRNSFILNSMCSTCYYFSFWCCTIDMNCIAHGIYCNPCFYFSTRSRMSMASWTKQWDGLVTVVRCVNTDLAACI